ncbi:hypothetical protein [Nonomuraea basaltis]|uniref:hypothetical protein n=1 Tax=Nonomuraea basaltis TaxID=2495887 RepID=UPI00110C4FB7|nr:hypothetical protein [Nonomuraea basaltis]TMR94002.1 hypothetical protein EJK15_36080 [Nonomuraea basaltis]
MRLKRVSLVAGGAMAALLLSGQAALAAAPPPGTPGGGCLAEGEIGRYLSKEGSAKAGFSSEFLDGLKRAGVTMEAIEPIRMVDGGTAAWLPVGERYDNIETPSGRVCYPGGFRFIKESTGTVYEIDTFWVLFAAVADSKFLATPFVNGNPRPGGELTMVNFRVPPALAPGNFVPHNGGIGPLKVVLSMDAVWADDLNSTLGTDFHGGLHWADLDIAWRGAPSRPIPSGTSLGMVGLNVVANAIQRGGPASWFPDPRSVF